MGRLSYGAGARVTQGHNREEVPCVEGNVEAALYPTELVMDHQAALGLTDAQASAIREELQRTQRELVDAEWELRREREALASVLAHPRVDEEAALAAAEQVIAREGAIKRLHLRLLVRIKNQLTAEQQARLTALRGDGSTRARPY